MPIPFYHPKPKPPAAFNGIDLPQNKANPISRAVFHWVSPILSVGYSRPLQAEGESDCSVTLTETSSFRLVDPHRRLTMPKRMYCDSK